MEKERDAKLEYTTPNLERFGTLSELTKSGRDKQGEDSFFFNRGKIVRHTDG